MSWKSVLRALVCFLLICSILVTCVKPMTVDALAVETAVALGIVAFFILASAGVVYTVHTQQDFVALGTSMQNHMHSWSFANDVAEIWDSQVEMWNNAFDDWDDEYGKGPMLIVKAGILLGLALWVKNIITGDEEVEVEGEAAPEGYAYYNDYLLPVLPEYDASTRPYVFISRLKSRLTCSFYAASIPIGSFGTSWGLSGSTPYCISKGDSSPLVSGGTYQQWEYVSHNESTTSNLSFDPDYIVWSNYDIYKNGDLILSASDPVYVTTEIVEPSAYVGEIPEQVQSGEMEPEQIPLLSSLALGGIISSSANAVSDVSAVSEGLATGTLTYDAFLEQITPEAETEPVTGTLADTDAGTFLDNLGDIISAPFKWIWEQLQSLFIPSEGFMEEKIDTLKSKYSFADSISKTGLALKSFLLGLGSKPPIIYIDLGASTGSHNLGGKTVFVDLTWYQQYKPTVDNILSAFLWLWFVWRTLLSLPGIIQGTSGYWKESTGQEIMDSLGIHVTKRTGRR